MFLKQVILITVLVVLSAIPLYSSTIHVPADYVKIQDAILAANSGDTVEVAYGVYEEAIMLKDDVNVIGISDVSLGKPVIKAINGNHPTVRGANNCTIDGFYLTADASEYEIVMCNNTSPTIINCTITGGTIGIVCQGACAAIIKGNEIILNSSDGISCDVTTGLNIIENVISDNVDIGISCDNISSPLIDRNLIKNNSRGIIVRNSSHPVISYNVVINSQYIGIGYYDSSNGKVEGNFVSLNSLGIAASDESVPEISKNLIMRNYHSGINCSPDPKPIIRCNIIVYNSNEGIYSQGWNSHPKIINNVISKNDGPGIDCSPARGYPEILINNIFKDNNDGSVSLYDSSWVEEIFMAYNNTWENYYIAYYCKSPSLSVPFTPQPGTGEISVDPLFRDPDKYDFRLKDGSQCIDKGDPAAEYNDPDGTRNDMGCYGGPDSGWVGPDFLMNIGSFHKSLSDKDFLKTDTFIPGSTIDLKVQLQNKDEITIDLYIYLITSIGNFYYPTWTPTPTPIHLTVPSDLIEYFSFLKIPVPANQPPSEFSFGWYSINTDTGEKIFPEMEYKFKIIQKPL
jgi:parallel beta-helix repeat protein